MANIRRDGRRPDELREITIVYDGLQRVDGSGRFSFGEDTKALASVSGPIEVRLAAEQPSRATFEVFIRPLSNVPSTQSKFLSHSIRSALSSSLLLNQNPRTLIQLVVQSLTPMRKEGGQFSAMAAMVNAASLALINSGSVPMKGVICAVAVGRKKAQVPSGSLVKTTLIVDPSEDESSTLEGGGCFAFLFAAGLQKVTSDASSPLGCEAVWSNWQASTSFGEEELVRARELARVSAQRIWVAMKASLEDDDHSLMVKNTGKAKEESDSEEDDDKMEI